MARLTKMQLGGEVMSSVVLLERSAGPLPLAASDGFSGQPPVSGTSLCCN